MVDNLVVHWAEQKVGMKVVSKVVETVELTAFHSAARKAAVMAEHSAGPKAAKLVAAKAGSSADSTAGH